MKTLSASHDQGRNTLRNSHGPAGGTVGELILAASARRKTWSKRSYVSRKQDRNLLALNATIRRPGPASRGKGFARVAASEGTRSGDRQGQPDDNNQARHRSNGGTQGRGQPISPSAAWSGRGSDILNPPSPRPWRSRRPPKGESAGVTEAPARTARSREQHQASRAGASDTAEAAGEGAPHPLFPDSSPPFVGDLKTHRRHSFVLKGLGGKTDGGTSVGQGFTGDCSRSRCGSRTALAGPAYSAAGLPRAAVIWPGWSGGRRVVGRGVGTRVGEQAAGQGPASGPRPRRESSRFKRGAEGRRGGAGRGRE